MFLIERRCISVEPGGGVSMKGAGCDWLDRGCTISCFHLFVDGCRLLAILQSTVR